MAADPLTLSGTHDRSLSFLVRKSNQSCKRENGSEYRAVKGLQIKIRSKNGILILFDHPQIVKESDSNISYNNILGCGDISAYQCLRP